MQFLIHRVSVKVLENAESESRKFQHVSWTSESLPHPMIRLPIVYNYFDDRSAVFSTINALVEWRFHWGTVPRCWVLWPRGPPDAENPLWRNHIPATLRSPRFHRLGYDDLHVCFVSWYSIFGRLVRLSAPVRLRLFGGFLIATMSSIWRSLSALALVWFVMIVRRLPSCCLSICVVLVDSSNIKGKRKTKRSKMFLTSVYGGGQGPLKSRSSEGFSLIRQYGLALRYIFNFLSSIFY